MPDAKANEADKRRPRGRAFVKYKPDSGIWSFLKKPSARLPVCSIDNEGMQFRSMEAPAVGDKLTLSLWSASRGKPARIRAQVSEVAPETRIGEQTYAFRVAVKFIEISSEAWEIISRLAP